MLIKKKHLKRTILKLINQYAQERNPYIKYDFLKYFEMTKRKFKERLPIPEDADLEHPYIWSVKKTITLSEINDDEYIISQHEQDELKKMILMHLMNLNDYIYHDTILYYRIYLEQLPIEQEDERKFLLVLKYRIGVADMMLINQANN